MVNMLIDDVIKSLEVTDKQLFNSVDGIALLVDIKPKAEYLNGVPTGKFDGMNCFIVIPNRKYASQTVKVPVSSITKEKIEKVGGGIKVKFKNLTAKFYRTANGDYAISAKADAIEEVIG